MGSVALRLLKVFVVFMAGLFGLFVFAGNLMDYDSNYQFVHHVLSMDTTFEGNALMWRAIESTMIHTIAYWGIILAEGIFSALALVGSFKMFKALKKSAKEFNRAKDLGFYAFMLGFVIWFIGFIVIGSEWFAMWQSSSWNGKDTAMGISTLWAGFVVLLALKDDELE